MDYVKAKKLLEERGQEQLLKYYDELSWEQREQLLSDIGSTDFSVLKLPVNVNNRLGEITPVKAVSSKEISIFKTRYDSVGLNLLKEGKVAAVLLAGGQGTRLGFQGPKGTFDMGISRTLTIFELQMRNILSVVGNAGRYFHIFIMVSRQNRDQTEQFFKDNKYFDYPENFLHFYVQDVAPTFGYDGKIFLDEKWRVSLAPNGNGGWYSSIVNSGLSSVIEREGIEWLNVYSVDNVLQKICDPTFIGATLSSGCRCGAKVVAKTDPEEKVGVLCNEDGKPTVLEYFEIPDEIKNKTENGELVYRYGVILNYIFHVSVLNKTLSGTLPYHFANKAVPHIENGVRVIPDKPCGYKPETLIVDMVKLTGNCLAYEVEREKEFAPVKNLKGKDSVDTARELLVKNGVTL